MRKFGFLSMAAAAVMMFGSCSEDHLNGEDGGVPKYPDSKDGVFFSVNIDLPNSGRGTRSQTINPGDNTDVNSGNSSSNVGVEIGKDYENYVHEVIVVLARQKDNSFIAAATVPTEKVRPIVYNKASYQLTTTLTLTQLSAFYSSLVENDNDYNANIFVFANPGETIKTIIFGKKAADGQPAIDPINLGDKDWVNKVVTLSQPAIKNIANKEANQNKGSFLMANASIATREIPSSIDDWRHYTLEANPFDLSGDNAEVNINNGSEGLGAIKLERAAARFDFRDGSPVGNFTYHVVKGDAGIEGQTESNLIDIVLDNMSLVNVNKSFYALRRVSPTGFNSNATLLGRELAWSPTPGGGYSGGNYVVDANQVWKTQTAQAFDGDQSPTDVKYSDHFFYPLFTNSGAINNSGGAKNWFTSRCEDVIKGELDNKDSWNPSNENEDGETVYKYSDYHIWTYATENTIAGYDDQKNGVSTGVVFKGKMKATPEAINSKYPDVKKLADVITNAGQSSPYLYSFGGNLYVGWDGIRNAAINAAVSGIKWITEKEEGDPDYDATKGHFEFTSIDRSNSLYVAVFGTGGFGTVTFTYTEYDVDTKKPVTDASGNVVQHTGTISDDLAVSPNSADAKWSEYTKSTTSANLATFKKTATDEKITIYQPSNDNGGGWGYYCYYYYWNRHNDNGNNGIMGPMEFAVVRNNVYKLAVTNIKQLGHPRLTENDPNRPTGGSDDETEDVYITVTAEVLPWVVRVNDIEF